MKQVHFFNGRSRLGIINNPYHQKTNNIGVEFGGDKVLSLDFLKKYDFKLNSYDFPLPENVKSKDYFDTFRNSVLDFKNIINQNLNTEEKQIVIGGDHIITFPSVLALIDRVGAKNIGYIHFDSHGDINTFKESPSGNFHGMYLRPLFDKFDIPQIDELVPIKIPKENSLFIGNLKLDSGEEKYFQKNKIKIISLVDLDKEKTFYDFEKFIKKFKYLHVSFDVDVLDKSIFPSTGIPGENGLKVDQTLKLLEIISIHPELSFDLAEYNPLKKGSDKSLRIAQKILKTVL